MRATQYKLPTTPTIGINSIKIADLNRFISDEGDRQIDDLLDPGKSKFP